MDQNTNSKLITSFLPHGTGVSMIKLLKEETGVYTGNVNSSRGTGSSAGASDFDSWVEVDVLDVVVDANRADEIFNFIYEKAGYGRSGDRKMASETVPQWSVSRLYQSRCYRL